MATSATNPAAALGDITRFAEMRKRLLFLVGALIVYRIGTFIPVPGIDAAKFAAFFSTQNGTLLGMFNRFSGGALQRFSIFALNVMPYITASIIVQMASMRLALRRSSRRRTAHCSACSTCSPVVRCSDSASSR